MNDHSHICDAEYTHELTLSIYDKKNLEWYQENIKKLILE